MGDWLGTGRVSNRLKEFIVFSKARKFARSLKLKNREAWITYVKSGGLPSGIPASPSNIYKGKGWKGYGDWLGNGAIAPHQRKFLDFEDAREYARSLKLRTYKEWLLFIKKQGLPKNIPTNPDKAYKGKGWRGVADWLGTTDQRI